MLQITESGMDFSLREEATFYLETSEIYKKVRSRGVSAVEFITYNKNKILVVEAKSSLPRSQATENKDFWGEILDKDIHSMLLFTRALLTDKTEEMGKELIEAMHKDDTCIVFLLILKDFEPSICNDLSDVYRKKVNSISRIYNADVRVINADQARKYGLIA